MPFDSRQIRIFAVLFLAVVALLTALWFLFLRPDYVPIFQNIRESDASQIVTELEGAGIEYRLENGGHDILVADDEAASARVAVAGAEIPMGGTTGFELFNENELGLTEFAQKINLQRAIQGELARTIMMLDGVDFARVHLAIPERTLFRAEQELPTAAVSLEMQPSRQMSSGSVAGIKQLVASSVPGLRIENVAVLDGNGSLMNAAAGTGNVAGTEPQSEREAVEHWLKIRATDAISRVLPSQPFDLQISAFEQITDASTNAEAASGAESDEEASSAAAQRAMGLEERALRVLVRTPQELGPEERSVITNVLVDTVELSTESGDVLDFSTGALAPSVLESGSYENAWAAPVQPAVPTTDTVQVAAWGENWSPNWLMSSWFLVPLAILMLVLLAIRPRRQLSQAETEDFSEVLRSTSLDLEGR